MNILKRLFGPSKREYRAEIERLSKLYETITDPKLFDLEIEPGGAIRMDLEFGISAKILAASFATMVAKADNWMSVEVGPFPSDQGTLLVTVKRTGKETPEFQVGKLKEEIERLNKSILVYQAAEESLMDKVETLTAIKRELRDYLQRATVVIGNAERYHGVAKTPQRDQFIRECYDLLTRAYEIPEPTTTKD